MFHALIRTHHITSRKKVAALKAAAKKFECRALLRSGGVPGVMYVEGEEQQNVQAWVDTVHDLRYKDYQLASQVIRTESTQTSDQPASLEEVETVKEMGAIMERKGLTEWWRKSMGFT